MYRTQMGLRQIPWEETGKRCTDQEHNRQEQTGYPPGTDPARVWCVYAYFHKRDRLILMIIVAIKVIQYV